MSNQSPSDRYPPTVVRSAIARVEWPTALLAMGIYGGFLLLTYFWAALPLVAVIAAGGWLVAWHGSLQHEVIHGHPTRSQRLNDAIGWPPLSLWLPYAIYREGHLVHHRDEHLTDPIEDPESSYLTQATWNALVLQLHIFANRDSLPLFKLMEESSSVGCELDGCAD